VTVSNKEQECEFRRQSAINNKSVSFVGLRIALQQIQDY
jgi:hypothetical protein